MKYKKIDFLIISILVIATLKIVKVPENAILVGANRHKKKKINRTL